MQYPFRRPEIGAKRNVAFDALGGEGRPESNLWESVFKYWRRDSR